MNKIERQELLVADSADVEYLHAIIDGEKYLLDSAFVVAETCWQDRTKVEQTVTAELVWQEGAPGWPFRNTVPDTQRVAIDSPGQTIVLEDAVATSRRATDIIAKDFTIHHYND